MNLFAHESFKPIINLRFIVNNENIKDKLTAYKTLHFRFTKNF